MDQPRLKYCKKIWHPNDFFVALWIINNPRASELMRSWIVRHMKPYSNFGCVSTVFSVPVSPNDEVLRMWGGAFI